MPHTDVPAEGNLQRRSTRGLLAFLAVVLLASLVAASVLLSEAQRDSLRISYEGYGLKNVERFFMPERTEDVSAGDDSIIVFEQWLESRDDELHVARDPAVRRR